jgi:hypothetical protein
MWSTTCAAPRIISLQLQQRLGHFSAIKSALEREKLERYICKEDFKESIPHAKAFAAQNASCSTAKRNFTGKSSEKVLSWQTMKDHSLT